MLVRGRLVDINKWIDKAIGSARVSLDPWPHVVVENIFPDELYQDMVNNFPQRKSLPTLSHTTLNRFVYWLEDDTGLRPEVSDFWHKFREETFDALWSSLEEKFMVTGRSIGAELLHDVTGYALGPHTDTPNKLITSLVYMPVFNDMKREIRQGTVLYHCDTPDPRGRGHKPDDPAYKEVKIVPYVANTMFAFVRSDVSFHGVRQTPIERRLFAFDVFR